MKKLYATFLILAFAVSAHAKNSPEIHFIPSEDFTEDIAALSRFFPCVENSENEKNVYRFIRQRLDQSFIFYYEQPLDTEKGSHSFASNIIVDFPGTRQGSTMIIAVPVNNYSGNQVNISLALKMCRHFADNPPDQNVKIVFLGSEYASASPGKEKDFLHFPQGIAKYFHKGSNVQTGSRVFLEDYFPEEDVFLLYINMESAEHPVEITGTTGKGMTPMWLLENSSAILEKMEIPFIIDIRKNRLFKAGYDERKQTDIYMEQGIPSLYITSYLKENQKPLLPETTANMLPSFLLSMSATKPVEEWERNYMIVPFRDSYRFIPEKIFIFSYTGVIFFFLLFALIFSKNFRRYNRKLIFYFWVIPWFFLLTFFFLLLATYITQLIVLLKGSATLWMENPFPVFAIKLLTAVVFFFSSLFILRRIKLPASASFYSSSAIFMIVINIIMFQFYSITLSVYAIWALAWIVVFSFARSRIVKAVCIAISYLLMFDITRYIFTLPALNLCDLLINDPVKGNLLISAVLLPMTMMIMRVLVIQTHIESRKYRFLRRVIYSAALLSLVSISVTYIRQKVFETRPQPVLAINMIDADKNVSTITLTSPAPLGSIEAEVSGESFNISTGSGSYTKKSITAVPFGTGIDRSVSYFLDRKNIVLEISPEGRPEKIDIDFFTEEGSILLDSNFPFTLDENLDSGSFHIGYNPDLPLKLDILIDRESSVWLVVRMIYRDPPFDIHFTGGNREFTRLVILESSLHG